MAREQVATVAAPAGTILAVPAVAPETATSESSRIEELASALIEETGEAKRDKEPGERKRE